MKLKKKRKRNLAYVNYFRCEHLINNDVSANVIARCAII